MNREAQGFSALLEVEKLKMHFPVRSPVSRRKLGEVKAVDDVSFEIRRGKTLGLVGESGCGKTTTGKCVLGINRPTSGNIRFNGMELSTASKRDFRGIRRQLQAVFQDPFNSLDPRQTVRTILKEAVRGGGPTREPRRSLNRVWTLLDTVKLGREVANRYPHELSGGERQRVGIARALACDPELIVCDEPVSALDVSIQAQIVNLFQSIQLDLGVAYLFIAHDLAVVRHVSETVGVMYLGRLVELADAVGLYSNPLHPYTKALISAVPISDYHRERRRERILLRGEVPSPMNVPSGCPFHPRCGYATSQCAVEVPEQRMLDANHWVACHNV